MQSLALPPQRGDGHLWMTALGLSLLANLALVMVIGLAVLESEQLLKPSTATPAPPAETVAQIFAVRPDSRPATTPAEKRFARTSEDQAATPPENPALIGERDTRATSDRAPDAAAPPLPSQAGIDPRNETDIETTENDYRDGSLSGNPAVTPPAMADLPPPPVTSFPPEVVSNAEPSQATTQTTAGNPPPPREMLAQGPNPVDVQVPRESATEEKIKPTPDQPSTAKLPPAPKVRELDVPAEAIRPSLPGDPAFSGYQRKTAVTGSISRSGRSALDVADSPLGRYQAAISRAVEQEWQRNCVRHRDFLTPGFLTVRFFVEADGKVRSVQFVGDMETGEIQKGFTLNSIRDAEIPGMPSSLRSEYAKEPLELIFRFYF